MYQYKKVFKWFGVEKPLHFPSMQEKLAGNSVMYSNLPPSNISHLLSIYL